MTTVDPGQGWRLLRDGEKIPQVRRYFAYGLWHDVNDLMHVGSAWNPKAFYPIAVPVESGAADNDEYVPIEVHRAALKEIDRLQWELRDSKVWWKEEIERLKAELEAVKQSQPDPEPEWFDLTPFGEHVLRPCMDHSLCSDKSDYWYTGVKWPEGSTIAKAKTWPNGWSKFRCLLKDAPPELVAKTSGLAKAKEVVASLPEGQQNALVGMAMPNNAPAADPDEWVTQDRVPPRAGIDEIHWTKQDCLPGSVIWTTATGDWVSKHGCEFVGYGVLHVRCRRRDLPPMPEPEQPKKETETVVFCEVIRNHKYAFGNEELQLVLTSKPFSTDRPTGRTVEREVPRVL